MQDTCLRCRWSPRSSREICRLTCANRLSATFCSDIPQTPTRQLWPTVPLTAYGQSVPDTRAAIARSTEEIERIVTRVRADLEETSADPGYGRGILLGIEWAQGQRGEAPVTGELPAETPPSQRGIRQEIDAATDVIYSRRRIDVPDAQGFAVGVEQTLLWLLADTEQAPG